MAADSQIFAFVVLAIVALPFLKDFLLPALRDFGKAIAWVWEQRRAKRLPVESAAPSLKPIDPSVGKPSVQQVVNQTISSDKSGSSATALVTGAALGAAGVAVGMGLHARKGVDAASELAAKLKEMKEAGTYVEPSELPSALLDGASGSILDAIDGVADAASIIVNKLDL